MFLINNYYYFESALTDEQCDKIIESGEAEMDSIIKSGGSIDATVDGRKSAAKGEGSISALDLTKSQLKRKNINLNEVFIRDTHVSWLNIPDIYDILHPFVNAANHQAGWNFQWDYSENMQYTKYGEKQFYGWHVDCNRLPYDMNQHPSVVGKIRKLSMTVNLSNPNEYTGGNLRFDFGPHIKERFHTCNEIRPRGSIIVFPSHIHHQVTPVKSGTRRSLVMWSLGLPFR
tara:strand:+ start:31 stop:720 length:690 start_codon:yes stop_codon:yes gene_type:complete